MYYLVALLNFYSASIFSFHWVSIHLVAAIFDDSAAAPGAP